MKSISLSEFKTTARFSSGWQILMRKVLRSERFCLLIMTEAVAQRCSVKKVFLETSQNSHEDACARVSFFRGWSATLLKKRPWHRCFPVHVAKLLRTSFFQNISDGCFCNKICLWGRWNPFIKTKMVLFLTRAYLISNSLKVVYLLSKMRLFITVGLSFLPLNTFSLRCKIY